MFIADLSTTVFSTILLCATAISSFVYILYVCTILKFRNKAPFNKSFFRLTLSLAAADLLTLFHTYFAIRIPEWGYLHSWYVANGGNRELAWYGYAAQSMFTYAQNIGVLVLTVNRFTAICTPLTYVRFWHKWLTWALFLPFIVSSVYFLLYLPIGVSYEYAVCLRIPNQCANGTTFEDRSKGGRQLHSDPLLYTFGNNESQATFNVDQVQLKFTRDSFPYLYSVWRMKTVYALAVTVTSVVMYAAIAHSLIKLRKKSASMKQKSSTKESVKKDKLVAWKLDANEKKLAVTSFIIFLFMFIFFLYGLLGLYVNIYVDLNYLRPFQIVTDLFGYMNPYIILKTSPNTRHHFLAFLKLRPTPP